MQTPDSHVSPSSDEQQEDVRQPPVPPDRQPDIVPQGDPPKPGDEPPMIASER